MTTYASIEITFPDTEQSLEIVVGNLPAADLASITANAATIAANASAISSVSGIASANTTLIGNHISDTENPHSVTATKIGVEEGANKYILPSDVVRDSTYVKTDNNYTDAAAAEVAKVCDKADQSTTYTKTEVDNKNTIKTIGETVSTIQFWTGTQAEYDLLTPNSGVVYLIEEDD